MPPLLGVSDYLESLPSSLTPTLITEGNQQILVIEAADKAIVAGAEQVATSALKKLAAHEEGLSAEFSSTFRVTGPMDVVGHAKFAEALGLPAFPLTEGKVRVGKTAIHRIIECNPKGDPLAVSYTSRPLKTR